MITELQMPSLSPTMEEGTIAAWHVKPGDTVSSGQVVAEVQTDKAVLEWEAMEDGVVAEIIIPAGGTAKVNMIAALLTSKEGEDVSDAVAKAKASNDELAGAGTVEKASDETPPPPAKPDPAEVGGTEPAVPFKTKTQLPTIDVQQPKPAAKPSVGAKRISPVAARMAAANGVDLDELTGTGPDGRVVKADVARAIQNGGTGRSQPGQNGNPFLRGGKPDFEDQAITPMRQVIGTRLLDSKLGAPHFQVTERISCGKLIELRAQLNAIDGVKISFNDLITKALALTLVRHPNVNSTFDGQTIRRWNTADISIAVAIPDGLITPILRGAEQLTLSQVSVAVKSLAKRATAGTLKPEEYQGGTFTISNLGMFGIEQFNAIINPPQAGILAVGGIKDEPVVQDGEVKPGKVMRLTLSADHRVIDGADGAKFMRDLAALLENPASLML